MKFRDRTDAGKQMAAALAEKYRNQPCVVFGIPRGGVVPAVEVARHLNHCPLDMVIARKIGHPMNEEYAIAATAENGMVIGNDREMAVVDQKWFQAQVRKQSEEARRRRLTYFPKDHRQISLDDRVAIVVDDGIATGLTMEMAIMELCCRTPLKVVVAVPVMPKDTYTRLAQKADEVVSLEVPERYLGAVGCYYHQFGQTEDAEVIKIMHDYAKETIN